MDDLNRPKISIVVATYNCSHLLLETLKTISYIKENRDYCEFIAIDGASNDGTFDLLNESSLFDVLVSEPDAGIADAWNKGVQRSSGEFVVFLNAGDFIDSLELNKVLLIFDGLCSFDEERILYGKTAMFDGGFVTQVVDKEFSKNIKHGFDFMFVFCVVGRKVFDRIGLFSLDYKIAIDTEWLVRCYYGGIEFSKRDYCVFMDDSGVSNKHYIKSQKEYTKILKSAGAISKFESVLRDVKYTLYFYLERKLKIRSILKRVFAEYKLFVLALFNSLLKLPIPPLNKFLLKFFGGVIDKGVVVHRGIRVFSRNPISIGSGTVINRGCYLDNRAPIKIGSNVSMAHECRIYTAGHDINSIDFCGVNKGVEVGDYVVFFANVVVMPGVKVGNNSVILPFSVVTKDVPENCVYGGVPATFKSFRDLDNPRYMLNYPFFFG